VTGDNGCKAKERKKGASDDSDYRNQQLRGDERETNKQRKREREKVKRAAVM